MPNAPTSKQPFESATVESIDVILAPGCGSDTLQKVVDALLGGTGWVIEPVKYDPTGREYDLKPSTPIDPATVFEIALALKKDGCIEDADPSFAALYPEPAEPSPASAPSPAKPAKKFEAFAAEPLNEDEYDWNVRFVRAHEAWRIPDSKSRQGAGIRIGHPDSGYLPHPELGANFNPELGYDFIDEERNTNKPGGSHGLSTASVISSPHDYDGYDASGNKEPFVAGIAPQAEIIPLRVAKPTIGIPAPVLFWVGADRLRDAIWYALTKNVHVISISLGWLPSAGLRRAVAEAVRQNVIVVAAAGNFTGPIVVWPAAYDDAIAMAACNARVQPWGPSARGQAVDATGPGENVWTAQPDGAVQKSSGTSHATATVAGIAALWLAHHGREKLLEQYAGGPSLAQVFRHVLRASCETWNQNNSWWGAGIVNAKKCLEHPLPPKNLEAFGSATAKKRDSDTVVDAFTGVPKADVQRRLANVLNVDEAKAAQLDAIFGRELRFWALTDPEFREAIESGSTKKFESFGSTIGAAAKFSPALKAALK